LYYEQKNRNNNDDDCADTTEDKDEDYVSSTNQQLSVDRESDLRTLVIDYCSDQSSSSASSLRVSEWSVGDIKQCFSIFKDLVNRSRDSVVPLLSNKVVVGQKTVDEEKVSCLTTTTSFDKSEIAPSPPILSTRSLKMDKNCYFASPRLQSSDDDDDDDDDKCSKYPYLDFHHQLTSQTNTTASGVIAKNGESWMQSEERRRRDKQSALDMKIIHSKLFGVLPPSILSILDSPVTAYEWFETHCSVKLTLDNTMEELKITIAEAKIYGEAANRSRELVMLLKHESHDDDDNVDQEQHRFHIEEETRKYKSSCDNLRELKVKIESLKVSIEKYRMTISKQFEQWYSFLQNHHFSSSKLLQVAESK